MSRALLIAGVLALAAPVRAGAPAPIPHPIERAFCAPVVVTGTVTSIEKEMVDAAPLPGAAKVQYRIALVKIDKRFAGADGLTHLKVGFVPPAEPDPGARRPDRGGARAPRIEEGREFLFFLAKHPAGGFYSIPSVLYPVEAKSAGYKEQIEAVSQALTAVADPMKALTTGNARERFHGALALITHYRMREGTRDVETVPISAEENRLILKAVAEGDWRHNPSGVRLDGFIAIYRLGLSEADGWKAPGGQQGEEYTETMRKAFIAWLGGPGKDFRIKKVVPKKQ